MFFLGRNFASGLPWILKNTRSSATAEKQRQLRMPI